MLRTLKAGLSLSLLILVVGSIATHEGTTSILAALGRMDGRWMLAGIAVQGLAVLSAVMRWRVLLASQRVQLRMALLARHFLIGRFVGVFTPSTLGLDGYRVLAASRESGRTAAAARAVLIEKGLSLTALALTSFALLPLGAARFYGALGLLASLVVGLLAFGGLWLMHRPEALRAVGKCSPTRLRSPLDKLLGALAADRVSPLQLLRACGLGIVCQLCGAVTFVCTGLALGVGATPVELLVVGHAIVLAMLLPISVAGAGLREGTAVAMLSLVGVPMGDALLVALLGFVVTQPAAILGGLLQVMASARERASQLPEPRAALGVCSGG